MSFESIQFDMSQIEDPDARAWIDRRRGELRGLFTAALIARPGVDKIDVDRAALSTALVEHSNERIRSGNAAYQDHVMASLAGIAARMRDALNMPAEIYVMVPAVPRVGTDASLEGFG